MKSRETAADRSPRQDPSDRDPGERGQLVLLAAIALALALVPLMVAYLQLGYHDDIGVASEPTPVEDAERMIDHGLHDATSDIGAEYSWQDRSAAVTTVRNRVDSTLSAVTHSALDDGGAYQITYNETRAQAWGQQECPRGPDRQFGDCVADDGIVVQERADRTHVVAIALDVTVTYPDTDGRVQITWSRTGG